MFISVDGVGVRERARGGGGFLISVSWGGTSAFSGTGGAAFCASFFVLQM